MQQAAPGEHAYSWFGPQAGCCGLPAPAEFRVQQIACVGAFDFDAAQDFVGDFSGGANHEPNRSPGARRAPFANSRAEILLRPSSCTYSKRSVVSSPHVTCTTASLALIVPGTC